MAALSTPHYANVLLMGQEGKHLSTISYKKAKWYLSKNLAVEVPAPAPYSRALQITFQHKQKSESEKWDLVVSNNQCVICGTKDDLTLHHIVPRVIRRHFPFEVKGHSREWCALLCEPCHIHVELVSQPIYKKDFPEYSPGQEDMNMSLRVIKAKNNLHKIPPEKLKEMLARSSYKTIEEVPEFTPSDRREVHSQRSVVQKKLIEEWAHKFIAEKGGLDGVHRYFFDLFLTFKPKYLPDWFYELRNK
jgi:hypothetical protein